MALIAALLFPWLFIWQGIDVTDQGYLLTTYRQFLRHPEAVEQAAHMWLTNTLGGIFDALFGRLGVVVHRAQWALCLSAGMLISFKSVSRVTHTTAAAIAVLVACLFLTNRRETWFSYNVLTALINVSAAYFMSRGLDERRAAWLIASGFLLGASPFARLPNVLGLALLSAPVFTGLLAPRKGWAWLRELGWSALGVVLGAATVLGCIVASGGFAVYKRSLASLFAPSVAKTGHGTGALLNQLIEDQTAALLAGGASIAVLAALFWVSRNWSRSLRLLVLAPLALLAAYGLAYTGSARDPEYWRKFVVGTCCLGLLGIAFGVTGRERALRIQAFVGAVALVVTPIGSDTGTRNSHWGMWLGLPLLLATLLSFDLAGKWRALRDEGFALLAVIALEGVARCLNYTYREAGRSELVYPVADAQLRGQFTSQARAKSLTEVLQALRQRTAPGDYLLTSESVPLLQYLTSTRPYLGIPWIMVDEDPAELQRLFRSVPQQRGCVPPLVRARGNARSPAWPYDVRRGLDRHHNAARKVIAAFLREHDYQRVWSNSFFEILEPAKAGHCR